MLSLSGKRLPPGAERSRRLSLLPAAVLTGGLLISLAVCIQNNIQKRELHEQVENALIDDIADAIHHEMQLLATTVVGASAFVEANRDTGAPLDSFYNTLLNDGSIPTSLIGLGIADHRNNQASVVQLLPANHLNRSLIHWNLLSEPRLHAALLRSAASGRVALSPEIKLGASGSNGIVMLSPVYSSATVTPPTEISEFSGRLLGWVFSPIQPQLLIEKSLGVINNVHLSGSHVLVFDGDQPSSQGLLFDNHRVWGTARLEHPSYQTIRVGQRPWTVGVQLTPAVPGPSGLHWNQALILISGGLLSLLASLICQQLVASHERMTQALNEAADAAEERAVAATVFEGSLEGVVITNSEGRVISVNQSFTQITGFSTQDLQGQTLNALRSGRHDADFYRKLWEELHEKGRWQNEIWNRTKSGDIRRHDVSISTVRDKDLKPVFYVAIYQDITQKHAAQEEILYQATHDPLTGLANRTLLIQDLEHGLAMARRYNHNLALLFMDLNGFKAVNDDYGHATGDALIRAVADRLRLLTRDVDTLCRQGGDEFVLLIPEAPSLADLTALAQRIWDAVQKPYTEVPTPSGKAIRISVSIGIARWPDHAGDADALLVAADGAMYRAKQRGGRQPELAEPRPST